MAKTSLHRHTAVARLPGVRLSCCITLQPIKSLRCMDMVVICTFSSLPNQDVFMGGICYCEWVKSYCYTRVEGW